MSIPPAPPAAEHGRDFDVTAMGLAAVDRVVTLASPLRLGGKTLAREAFVSPGGQAAVASAAVAVLGGKSAFVGRLGAEGAIVLDTLRLRGVDISHAVEVSGSTQTAFVLLDPGGRRTIAWLRPDGARIPPTEIPRDLIARSAVLLLDGHQGEADVEAARAARKSGTRVVLDLEEIDTTVPALLDMADAVICDPDFLRAWTRQEPSPVALKKILSAGSSLTVAAVTLGEKGVVAVTKDEAFRVPAATVEVRDTTGAGDVFHGAFGIACARGLPNDEALSFAVGAASLSTRGMGAMGSLPTWPEAAGAAPRPRPYASAETIMPTLTPSTGIFTPTTAVPEPAAPPSAVGPRPRVLIVDDNQIVHHTLGRLLASHGFEVVAARSAEESIRKFGETRPDVVIMDVNLPDTSGLAAVEALKAKVSNCPPIIIYTGYGDEVPREAAREKGADAYITKPAAPEEVIRVIEGLLAGSRR